MASKTRLSLLQLQKSKLKKQRALATTSQAKALLDQKINKVNVRIVDTKKLLSGSPSPKALPPGTRGGSLAKSKRPRRRNINTNPSSKTTRTGSQSPGSIRNELAAVRRAKAEIGRNRMGPLSTIAEAALQALLKPVAREVGYQGGKAIRKALGGGEPTLDSKGNPIKKKPDNSAAINARLKKEKAERAAALAKTRGNKNSAILRDAPSKGKSKPTPTPKVGSSKVTPPKKTAKPATTSNSQNLRAGRSPDKPAKQPAKKVYGSTGRKDLKQSKRMAAALKNLKVRRY